MLREDGSLELYESEAEFRVSLSAWPRASVSASAFVMSRAMNLQPCSPARRVSSRARSCRDGRPPTIPSCLARRSGPMPSGWAPALRRRVKRVDAKQDGVTLTLADGTTRRAKHLVIAAGAWSHLLARNLGDRIPLETERGYNTTLPTTAFDVKRQLIFPGTASSLRRSKPGCASAARWSWVVSTDHRISRARRPWWRKPNASCRGLIPEAAANGWAFARRCRTRFR